MCNRREAIEEGDVVVVHVGYGTMYSVKVTRGQTLAMKKGALRCAMLRCPFIIFPSTDMNSSSARDGARQWKRPLAL